MGLLANDKVLLALIAKRDSNAFNTLYKNYFSAVRHFVINNQGDYDDANDIFQEAVIALYEKVKDGDFELSCQLSTYIYSICRRLWLKKLQRERSKFISIEDTGLIEEISTESDIEIEQAKNKDFEIMNDAIQTIGEPCKSILTAFYIDKKDMETIADEFGYTNAANAKNQKYKCLTRLKRVFFEKYNKE